jgi:uncharacterized membrane protein
MAQARESLRDKWGLMIGTFALYLVVTIPIACIPVAGWIISILISGPIFIGKAIFTLSVSRK